MRWPRGLSVLSLALLLAVGVSCTSSDTSLTSPAEVPVAAPAQQQPSQLLGGIDDLAGGLTGGLTDGLTGGLTGGSAGGLTGTVIGTLGRITDLLTCTPQEYAVTIKSIGPAGGEIRVGTHRLYIPRNALRGKTFIKAEQMTGPTNSIRFSPEGLRFENPAVLTMSYENCVLVLLQKKIVYTDESLNIRKVLRSLDLFKRKTVSAPIDHFSRYAVAY
jgi:hypothetical protein